VDGRLTAAARAVPPSGIREIYNLVAGRPDMLHLEVGEPDFPTPHHIVEAGIEAARRGVGYTQTAGVLELREALCEKLERVNGVTYTPDQVLVTQGAVEAVAVIFAAALSPGDEVLLPDPGWPNYSMAAILNDARLRFYRGNPASGFRPDVEEIARALTPRTRLLVLNSPANPTGAVIGEEDVRAIVSLAAANGTLVLSDEVYEQLVFEGRSVAAASFDPEWVIGVYSFSKTYAMTGWRVGYLAAPADVAAPLNRIQEPFISCVSEIAQAGALAALHGPQDCVAEMCEAYRRRRDLVVELFANAGIRVAPPGGAFYLMLPLATGADSLRAARSLVDEGVAVAPGSAFGEVAADHLRLSLAGSEQTLREAVKRITGWYLATEGGAAGRPAGAEARS
jgi:aspartate/methionine/tyrosine aminotransferase